MTLETHIIIVIKVKEAHKMSELKVNLHYPASDKYTYETYLDRLNLDEERRKDLASGNGFVITSARPIKDDVKDPNGIFSNRWGRGLGDLDPFSDRYSCRCGLLKSRFNKGQICPVCKTKVDFVDDNFGYFGWIVLEENWVIHPTLYMSLQSFIGTEEFRNILVYQSNKDEDGNDIEGKVNKKEPFFGIGMIEFHNRFDEIMEYYKNKFKTQAKQDKYKDIMGVKDVIFTQSIPVFTTLLRPYTVSGSELHYESTNAIYKIMASLAVRINSNGLKMNRNKKSKNELLYDLQMKIKELFDEIQKILAGKKGAVRGLMGGRFNFSARSVIGPNHKLHNDEIMVSYQMLCSLLQQQIINILHKAYNMHYNEAYIFLDSNRRYENPIIKEIINSLIRSHPRGLPMLINRNPTINYGGILQMYCIGMCSPYLMQLPNNILPYLAADSSYESYANSIADRVNCWKAKLYKSMPISSQAWIVISLKVQRLVSNHVEPGNR